MSEINTVSLLQEMRALALKAQGSSVETQAAGNAFQSVFSNALQQVNNLNTQADTLKTRYELGDKQVSLAQVMVANQKSNLAFEATIKVRNKLVQAYQDVMNMPV